MAAPNVNPPRPGVMLEAQYWNVPSPAAEVANSDTWWWDHLASQANAFAQAGFTAIWIPPANKGWGGAASAGYDPFDDYDIGSKDQKGGIPTRFGNRTQLQRACAIFRANGLSIYADIVDSHRDGDLGNFNFQYADAFGNPTGGRFAKSFWDFYPTAPIDNTIPDTNPASPDGDWIMPTTGGKTVIDGNEWIWADYGMKQSGSWLTTSLDLQGYRFDAVRSSPGSWLYSFMNYGPMAGKFCVSENWVTDIGALDGWYNSMSARTCVFDFPLRENYIEHMCNNPINFNMASLDHAGYAGMNPFGAVTFVENHDTDNHRGNGPIYRNKLLGYALILTSEGYPCVFYKDWSTDAGCYGAGMQAQINALIWIHQNIASGATIQRWMNASIYCYERLGGNRLLTALNASSDEQQITCWTGFGPNVNLHDYTGNSADITTDGGSNATFKIPALGYVSFSVTGILANANPAGMSIVQQYDGASDLDIQPANTKTAVNVCEIYVDSGTPISGVLTCDIGNWTAATRIDLTLTDPTGAVVMTQSFKLASAPGTALTANAAVKGSYTFNVQAFDTPNTNAAPSYSLVTTYNAPKTL